MEHPLNDQEDHPRQYKNNKKLCNEKQDPLLSLKESQWNLRQQYDYNFSVERNPLLMSEEINRSKIPGL